jgi:TRAP-type C4-dicarboxylate transport system permease small subunit
MIINGSLPLSIIFVTSILSPRHIRWTLLICNVIILWFLCAVYFNNTKDPLVVPDFNTQASSLAANELWISFVAPWAGMAIMFLISCFLKMPNS